MRPVEIRTVTCLVDPGYPIERARVGAAGSACRRVKAALESGGFTVQTLRLASRPFSDLVQPSGLTTFARDLEACCLDAGFDYLTIGPARLGAPREAFRAIPDALASTTVTFAAAVIAEHGEVDFQAIREAAAIICALAAQTPDGFTNLRFSALAGVPPGVPFLPAAFHDGLAPTVAIGVEGASLAALACDQAASLADARTRLAALVEAEANTIMSLAKPATQGGGCQLSGLDFSLAPFPVATRSVGTALERLTGVRVGERGTLAAAAFLADSLDRARFPRAGFCGLFLPVFEDSVLAARAAEHVLTLGELLLYASVCGTGLDTVPLPGAIGVGELTSILLDVGALATRLGKPLSARLMPIPGKVAGDPVEFDFAYFAPSRVMSPGASALGGLLGGADMVELVPRSW